MSGVLFLVPARGGSRRVPGKNLRTVAGIPLVGQAIRTARTAAAVTGPGSLVVCSTDDAAIAETARAWGAEVLDRPAELATDGARSVDVALHALDVLEGERGPFRAIVLVQPTSPLTDPRDLVAAVATFDAGAPSVVSVAPSHPADFHQGVDGVGRITAPGGGHDASLLLTGAFYVTSPSSLRRAAAFVLAGETVAHVVPAERSIDVDEPSDLALAEALAAARPVRPLRIADREIADGRVFVIAEAGVNHNGDVALAHRLVDAAADSGADAVKFQTFDPSAHGAALPRDAWQVLQAHARDRGLAFLATPFDDPSADLLEAIGVAAFTVGSAELTDLPSLGRLAARGRPILVSTASANMVEVATAVDAIRATGSAQLALLHGVSPDPSRAADPSVRTLVTMRAAFSVQTGWSDHAPWVELALASVALGATIVEKPIALDATGRGRDERESLEPSRFAAMVAAIRVTSAALGSEVYQPLPTELPTAAAHAGVRAGQR